MKATKDKDGNISWEHEDLNPDPLFSGKPMEKDVPGPSKMDKLKERAKELASQEEEPERF